MTSAVYKRLEAGPRAPAKRASDNAAITWLVYVGGTWMNVDEYEREARGTYAAFAATIASILSAAIGAEKSYRLQQVMHRAKSPASLRGKLAERGLAATMALERDIKDLAGCRIIFYTNGDVTRLINSGVIHQNFDVLEVKVHHPGREDQDSSQLYISNHYIVALRPERIALPEYAHFADMRCEIQIQTILNHAWAEMAHDTIYKEPELGNFGGREFDGIKTRMQKVSREYLVPAGYEFQKIANDFQRLIEGKALFDGDALDAIVEAADNNVRAAALETFAESVLPLYDDLHAIYAEIVERLVVAADRARKTPSVGIETPYGALPAKTYGDIVKAIAGILARYRHLDVNCTFEALCRLYGWAGADDERKPLQELGNALAKHDLHVWRQNGPVVQAMLVERIEALDQEERRALQPLLTSMLSEVLGTEVTGTTSNSSSVTFHSGAVVASDELRVIRTKAIDLLKRQFALAESEMVRGLVLQALQSAARHPMRGGYSNAIAQLVVDDTCTVLRFLTEIVPALGYQSLQTTEDWVHRRYWAYAELPDTMRSDPGLVAARTQVEAAALAFRDTVNANADFCIYKTLVGFNSVYPPAWREKNFRYEEAEAYRAEQVEALLASVNEANAGPWFDRINRYARTESDDAATFPVFGKFLNRLAETQPSVVLSYVDRLEGPLSNFLPCLLAGLMRSAEREHVVVRIDAWLRAGKHVDQVAWYLRFADPFDEVLLRRVLDSAIQHNDPHAVRNALIAAVRQFEDHPGSLIEEVFLPALHYLDRAQDKSWVRMPWYSWLRSPIVRALTEDQATLVLGALASYPTIEFDAEYIAAAIAERWPTKVVAFLGERQALARTDAVPPRYDPIPFEVHELQAPLAAAPDILLAGARTWFDADPHFFAYGGGRLLASVFPGLSHGLDTRLAEMVAAGNEADRSFVLGVLSAFEGQPCVSARVKVVVASFMQPEAAYLLFSSELRRPNLAPG